MGWDEFYKRQKALGNWTPDPDSTCKETGITSAGFIEPDKFSEFNNAFDTEHRLQDLELKVFIMDKKAHTHWWKR